MYLLEGIYIKKRTKGIFVRENLKKISIIIKNIIWSEITLMHQAVHPSNYFLSNSFIYNQAEQIKKGVICIQILLEIQLAEQGRFHFQGRTTFYTPVLVPPSRHMTSKWRQCTVMTSHRWQYDVISVSCTCRAVM